MQILVGGYAQLALLTVQGLVLIPLYLRYLGPHVYGAWLGSGDVLAWLGVLDFGVASIMIQRIAAAHAKGAMGLVGDYLASGLAVQIALVSALVLATVIVSQFLPAWMRMDGEQATVLSGAFVVAGIGMGLGVLNSGVSGFLLALQRAAFPNAMAVVAGLCSIAATILLLWLGWGLWALAASMVVRNGLLLVANAAYAASVYTHEIGRPLRARRDILRELVALSPSVFLSSTATAAVGRSEAALIAIFVRPEAATMYVLTKRAADIGSMLLARFGAAIFPGFAHLFGTGEYSRASRVFADMNRIYIAFATLFVAAYIAMNHTFVSLWVGSQQYGGYALTVLIGLATLLAGYGQITSYLVGATGRIAEGCYLVFAEAVVRLALMAILLRWFGIVGLPIAPILTAGILAFGAVHIIRRELGVSLPSKGLGALAEYAGQVAILGGSVILGMRRLANGWPEFCAVACVLVLVSSLIILLSGREIRALVRAQVRLSLGGSGAAY